MDIWKITARRKLFSSHIVNLEGRMSVNPRNGKEDEYYIASFPDWCNIIAVTPEEDVVLIRHFRHGTRNMEIELPGGCIDEGENAVEAGIRELEEETGYKGENAVQIANFSPNPSFQTNRCFTVLIENAQKFTGQSLDEGEDIEILKAPLREIPKMIKEGEISHSMMVAAFYYYELYKRS